MNIDEANEFVTQDDLTLNELNPLSSPTTNINILANNDKLTETYLTKLKAFCVLIYQSLDVDVLVASVLNRITSQKTSLSIPYSINVGQTIEQTSLSVTYQIKRIDTYAIEITNITNSNWDVSKLIISVKNQLEYYVNAAIKADSTNKKILIKFADAINTNYQVIIL